jgi:hypothetical protein
MFDRSHTVQTKTISTIAALILAASANTALAGHFDGKTALLCSIYQLYECDPPNGCVSVTPSEVQGMSHFDVDFRKKSITRAGVESAQKSTIQSTANIDGKLIIHGVEDGSPEERDGAGWSVSIMDPEGTMVMAIAGDGFGIMGLGACSPK